ncbi:Ppx/GppA phosphatase family-domain-containing protein [Microdochium trichocladiopsis]|uniref:Ppx/GppA phosphatase family-domain-containing protein n=1 Tax=Microdochium trichocladiopsis TaxID=1682393 RepID=A0A9P8XT28_9PEZI|nr:Ppx/GppA phosphatase family-domain-containing protein [Microdochium trichocladiopsis]KAH7012566.1 Ppx/GppA phosphatase family-domain-containing protein [Microdochium trichocladiopsis]
MSEVQRSSSPVSEMGFQLVEPFALLPPSAIPIVQTSTQAIYETNPDLQGVVDMGSNGIRFSVTDLSSDRARILPTVHVYRVDISLYDAQFDPETGKKIPIPAYVIQNVVAALVRFQIVCVDLRVPKENIHVVATEATRGAINSAEFIDAIKSGTGLQVELLKKEDEGRIGALGVASGFSDVQGLLMDLGGGSTQITWMIYQGGTVRISEKGSFSFPYGAAALSRRLDELTKGKSKKEADEAVAGLREEIVSNLADAYEKLKVPSSLIDIAREEGGFPLYLSGGGFRGWGYLLLYMEQTHGQPHPISIINGYTVGKSRFEDTKALKEIAKTAHSIFRVSDRRRKQVPAVAFLVNALAEAIPYGIQKAHFCQGSVREGVLFKRLGPSIRLQDPLEVATRHVAPPYMGELPPREVLFKELLRQLITPEEVWWAAYLGRIGYLISRLYPSGKIAEEEPRVVLLANWIWNMGSAGNKEGVRLTISVQKVESDPAQLAQALRDHVRFIEKVGKKKNWIGGENGWGMKVQVEVVEEDIG